MLENNKLWKGFAFTCLLYVQDKNVLSIYSIHPSFSILILEWSNLVPWSLLRRHCLKHFCESQKKKFLNSHMFFKLFYLAVNIKICSVMFTLVIEF